MDVRLLVTFVILSIDLSFTVVSASGAGAGTGKGISVPPLTEHHPKDWRFTLPKGDAVKGRAVFARYRSHYYCSREVRR